MDLLDELVAVNVTLEKWEEIRNTIISLNNFTGEACGFCKLYICADDICPASERCAQISVIYDAQHIIKTEATKNISWLKKRKTMLTKKIKAKETKSDGE